VNTAEQASAGHWGATSHNGFSRTPFGRSQGRCLLLPSKLNDQQDRLRVVPEDTARGLLPLTLALHPFTRAHVLFRRVTDSNRSQLPDGAPNPLFLGLSGRRAEVALGSGVQRHCTAAPTPDGLRAAAAGEVLQYGERGDGGGEGAVLGDMRRRAVMDRTHVREILEASSARIRLGDRRGVKGGSARSEVGPLDSGPGLRLR
jgi:hypothetical protein